MSDTSIFNSFEPVESSEIVRCHECMYHKQGKCFVPKFHLTRGTYTEDKGFCAWGKRKANQGPRSKKTTEEYYLEELAKKSGIKS